MFVLMFVSGRNWTATARGTGRRGLRRFLGGTIALISDAVQEEGEGEIVSNGCWCSYWCF